MLDKNACTLTVCSIKKSDLPLSCPPEGAVLWNAHPKVYLPMGESAKVTCPYCGTQFVMTDEPQSRASA